MERDENCKNVHAHSMQAMPFAETSLIFRGQTYCFELQILAGEDSLVDQASLFHIEVSRQALIQKCNVNSSIMHIYLHNCLAKPTLLTYTLRLVLLFYILLPSTITTYLGKQQWTGRQHPFSLHEIFASKNPQPATAFRAMSYSVPVGVSIVSL